MKKISFRYCPVCGAELDTGKIKFPAPHSILDVIEAEGKYYSDSNAERYDGHPVKKVFQTCDKKFIISTFGNDDPAGYCKDCNKIFTEFEVTEY